MTDIKELALRHAEAAGVKGFHWDGSLYDFVEPFLAAYLAEQEPVDYRYKGTDGFWYRKIPSDVRVVQTQPLFTAPPLPEPAHSDHPMRHYDRTCPACNEGAAPSSEEVREVVERLHEWYKVGESLTARDAADLIERLAARIT
jgi:hypothetical protein